MQFNLRYMHLYAIYTTSTSLSLDSKHNYLNHNLKVLNFKQCDLLEFVVGILDMREKKKTRETIMDDLKGDLYIIWMSQISFIRTITLSFHGSSGFGVTSYSFLT